MNRLARILITLVFLLWPKISVRRHNADRVPRVRPVLTLPHHMLDLDIPALTYATSRQVRYMAKIELFQNRLFAWFMRMTGAFPVDRTKNDVTAIKTAIRKLLQGENVGIFPEGHRQKTDEIGPIFAGVLTIASRAGKQLLGLIEDDAEHSETNPDTLVPMVACGIYYGRCGKDNSVKTVDVWFGEPFTLSDLGESNEERLAGIRDRMAFAQEQAKLVAESQPRRRVLFWWR